MFPCERDRSQAGKVHVTSPLESRFQFQSSGNAKYCCVHAWGTGQAAGWCMCASFFKFGPKVGCFFVFKVVEIQDSIELGFWTLLGLNNFKAKYYVNYTSIQSPWPNKLNQWRITHIYYLKCLLQEQSVRSQASKSSLPLKSQEVIRLILPARGAIHTINNYRMRFL